MDKCLWQAHGTLSCDLTPKEEEKYIQNYLNPTSREIREQFDFKKSDYNSQESDYTLHRINTRRDIPLTNLHSKTLNSPFITGFDTFPDNFAPVPTGLLTQPKNY